MVFLLLIDKIDI